MIKLHVCEATAGNTLFGLGEGWCLGSACRGQNMMQKVHHRNSCVFFIFLQFCASHMIKTPDNGLLYSHMGSSEHYTDFVVGSWQDKVRLMSSPTDSDICVLTYSYSR